MRKYALEFILSAQNISAETIKNAVTEFAEDLDIAELAQSSKDGQDFKIRMRVDDPTIIFDICGQFGRIKSAKVDEEDR